MSLVCYQGVDSVIDPIGDEYDFDSANESTVMIDKKVDRFDEVQRVGLHTPYLTYEIPRAPQNVEFSIAGKGCATVQSKLSWKTAIRPSLSADVENLISAPCSIFASMKTDGIRLAHDDHTPKSIAVELCVQ